MTDVTDWDRKANRQRGDREAAKQRQEPRRERERQRATVTVTVVDGTALYRDLAANNSERDGERERGDEKGRSAWGRDT